MFFKKFVIVTIKMKDRNMSLTLKAEKSWIISFGKLLELSFDIDFISFSHLNEQWGENSPLYIPCSHFNCSCILYVDMNIQSTVLQIATQYKKLKVCFVFSNFVPETPIPLNIIFQALQKLQS